MVRNSFLYNVNMGLKGVYMNGEMKSCLFLFLMFLIVVLLIVFIYFIVQNKQMCELKAD